jgi:hypothetical protein
LISWIDEDFMPQDERPKIQTPRGEIAHALPGLVAFLFLATWLPEKNLVGRVLEAAIGGVLFQGGGLLAFFFAAALIAKISGDPYPEIPPRDVRVTGAVLLVIAVWILGQHWVSNQEQRVSACLRESIGEARYVLAADLSQRVHQCAQAPHGGYSDPDE